MILVTFHLGEILKTCVFVLSAWCGPALWWKLHPPGRTVAPETASSQDSGHESGGPGTAGSCGRSQESDVFPQTPQSGGPGSGGICPQGFPWGGLCPTPHAPRAVAAAVGKRGQQGQVRRGAAVAEQPSPQPRSLVQAVWGDAGGGEQLRRPPGALPQARASPSGRSRPRSVGLHCPQLQSGGTRGPASWGVCGAGGRRTPSAPPWLTARHTVPLAARAPCLGARVCGASVQAGRHAAESQVRESKDPPPPAARRDALRDSAELPEQGLGDAGSPEVCWQGFLSLLPDWTTVASGQGIPPHHLANTTEDLDVCGGADSRARPRRLLEIKRREAPGSPLPPVRFLQETLAGLLPGAGGWESPRRNVPEEGGRVMGTEGHGGELFAPTVGREGWPQLWEGPRGGGAPRPSGLF